MLASFRALTPAVALAGDVDGQGRMVTGFYLSLDPVGDISTGLCIAHSIMRKDDWLVQHGITGEWPCWGRMDCIHVDNAKEFRGKTLRTACERYGIEIVIADEVVEASLAAAEEMDLNAPSQAPSCSLPHPAASYTIHHPDASTVAATLS